MAYTGNVLFDGMSGAIGKQIVFKQYSYGTVVARYPDMSNIKPSRLQKKRRTRFLEAVKYAQGILRNAELKAGFQKKIGKGKSVYHTAIKEYLAGVA